MARATESDRAVRDYYDLNTPVFSHLGSSGKVRSIHRALWPPGVKHIDPALNVSNELILQTLLPLAGSAGTTPCRVADLGCGLGGTLFFVLEHFPGPVQGYGLTLSHVQARVARRFLNDYAGQLNGIILTANYMDPPLAANLDAAFEIEAFAHTSDPAGFFAATAGRLRPGGRLVMIDDFLTDARPPANLNHRQWLHAFRRGWRVPGLRDLAWVLSEACQHRLNLVHERSLAPWLRFRTLPALMTNWLLRTGFEMPVTHPLWPSMLGSLALQHCLKAGLVDYRLLVFEKQN